MGTLHMWDRKMLLPKSNPRSNVSYRRVGFNIKVSMSFLSRPSHEEQEGKGPKNAGYTETSRGGI